MNWIQNVSIVDIKRGHHIAVGENSMLIQIVDPDFDFPHPKYKFKYSRKFKFLDTEDKSDNGCITQEQADQLVESIQFALDKKMDVIVHCHAGLCRSGAVAEIGIMLGFGDTGSFRSPNLLVKHRMLNKLGLPYDENEPHTWNGNQFEEDWENDNEKVFILANALKQHRLHK